MHFNDLSSTSNTVFLVKCIDTDGNGKIELNEFLAAFQDEIGYGHGQNKNFFLLDRSVRGTLLMRIFCISF